MNPIFNLLRRSTGVWLDVVSAEATPYMSNRVDTRSCQRRKFWPEKTSIFETSGNGFAKMVDVPEAPFDISGTVLLISTPSAISP